MNRMGRPAAADARDTRREILDAALDLFAERGFHATSMRALARAVGVRESAIYHHFSSKEALLEAVLDDRVRLRVQLIEGALAELGDLPLSEILTRIANAVVALVDTPRERKFLRLALGLGASMPDPYTAFRHFTEEPRRALEKLFAELRRSGRIRPDVDLEVFVIHFIAPIAIATGALMGAPRGPLRAPLRSFLRDHVAFMVRAAGGTRR